MVHGLHGQPGRSEKQDKEGAGKHESEMVILIPRLGMI